MLCVKAHLMDMSSCNSTGLGFMTSSTSGACATFAPGHMAMEVSKSLKVEYQAHAVQTGPCFEGSRNSRCSAADQTMSTHHQLLPWLQAVHASHNDG